jgi:hypothetical protein
MGSVIMRFSLISMAWVTIIRMLSGEDMPKIMIVQAKHSPAVSRQAVHCHHQNQAKSCAFSD